MIEIIRKIFEWCEENNLMVDIHTYDWYGGPGGYAFGITLKSGALRYKREWYVPGGDFTLKNFEFVHSLEEIEIFLEEAKEAFNKEGARLPLENADPKRVGVMKPVWNPNMDGGIVPLNTNEGIWQTLHYNSPWQTGVPTEEGCFYALQCKGKNHPEPYYGVVVDGTFCAISYTGKLMQLPPDLIAWQKIDPYKGE